jgi:hypothetical protein
MLYAVLQVLTVMLTAFTAVFVLAHAFELPGKKRLNRDEYFVVQRIYYPGFTIGGFAEIGSLVAALILLLITPPGSLGFWLTLLALVGLAVMHAIYWLVTHPVNKHWLRGETLGSAGSRFFATGQRSQGEANPADWTALRDRWEHSHLTRAVLASISLLALVVSLVVER